MNLKESNTLNYFPLPPFYDPLKVGEIWRVPYQERAEQARLWAEQQHIPPASGDRMKISLLLVDVQNTFCIPGFELFVGGRSGLGAVEDNRRLVEFIYRNLGSLTDISLTMDTHQAMQIFHPIFLVDAQGNSPPPYTMVTEEEIRLGKWRFNPSLAFSLGVSAEQGQSHLAHYVATLRSQGKYDLTIWPYHAMLGGIGHALVSAVEEAVFIHTIARRSQADLILKGELPLTENYSAIGPEVIEGPHGETLGEKDDQILRKLQETDALVITGQAQSHCVAWTIADLLSQIQAVDADLAKKIYLLEDCTSPVVVPGAADFTDLANEAYARFAEAGMHRVQSTVPLSSWPDIG